MKREGGAVAEDEPVAEIGPVPPLMAPPHMRAYLVPAADQAMVPEAAAAGSQPRSVKATLFADALRFVYSMGLLELHAGPWCYGRLVRLRESNTEVDGDSSDASDSMHHECRAKAPMFRSCCGSFRLV